MNDGSFTVETRTHPLRQSEVVSARRNKEHELIADQSQGFFAAEPGNFIKITSRLPAFHSENGLIWTLADGESADKLPFPNETVSIGLEDGRNVVLTVFRVNYGSRNFQSVEAVTLNGPDRLVAVNVAREQLVTVQTVSPDKRTVSVSTARMTTRVVIDENQNFIIQSGDVPAVRSMLKYVNRNNEVWWFGVDRVNIIPDGSAFHARISADGEFTVTSGSVPTSGTTFTGTINDNVRTFMVHAVTGRSFTVFQTYSDGDQLREIPFTAATVSLAVRTKPGQKALQSGPELRELVFFAPVATDPLNATLLTTIHVDTGWLRQHKNRDISIQEGGDDQTLVMATVRNVLHPQNLNDKFISYIVFYNDSYLTSYCIWDKFLTSIDQERRGSIKSDLFISHIGGIHFDVFQKHSF